MVAAATIPTTTSERRLFEVPSITSGLVTVEIVIPVYNEELVLDANVRRLRRYLDEHFPFPAQVTIADNASTDDTWGVATELAEQLEGVEAVRLAEKGRGRALRAVWSASEAPVVAYMDVDLATDLDGLLPLVAPLLSGHSDLAIGTRLAHGARVHRGPKRELISRAYNLIVRATMRSGFSDAQCGFKALRRATAQRLLPLVSDQGWFFDTELLILAEANGMRIHEVPVDWVDDADSRVNVVSTALGDLKGLVRVAFELARGRGRTSEQPAGVPPQARRFGGIGGLSTAFYLVVLLVLRPSLGTLAANAIALGLAALGNAAAHARLTLPNAGSRSDEARRARRAFKGEVVCALAVGLALSTAMLVATTQLTTSVTAMVLAVLAANAVVSVGRFVSFRARMLRQTSQAAQ